MKADMPVSPGRKQKGRVRKTYYLDKPVADLVGDLAEGKKDASNVVNRLIKRGLKLTERDGAE